MNSVQVTSDSVFNSFSVKEKQAPLQSNEAVKTLANIGKSTLSNSDLPITRQKTFVSALDKIDNNNFASEAMLYEVLVPLEDTLSEFITKKLTELNPQERKDLDDGKCSVFKKIEDQYVVFSGPSLEGKTINGQKIDSSMVREATEKEKQAFRNIMTFLKTEWNAEKEKPEEKKESIKSSHDLVEYNRTRTHIGNKDINSDAAASLEKDLIVVSLMRAFSEQTAKKERSQQEKEMEKTKECMTLNMRYIAKQALLEDIEKAEINATIIHQKELQAKIA